METKATELIKIGRKYSTADLRFLIDRQHDGWFMLDRTNGNEYFLTKTKAGMAEEAAFWIKDVLEAEAKEEEPVTMPAPPSLFSIEKNHGDINYCQCCGRKVGADPWWVVVVDGGAALCRPEDSKHYYGDGGFMGAWPIGRECVKRVPLEYRTKNVHRP